MSIHRLEPAKQFVTRMVLLNRFHAPDEDDYDGALSALGAVHRGFPSAEPHEQAAYLVAAVVDAAPFAEANFAPASTTSRTCWCTKATTWKPPCATNKIWAPPSGT